MNGDSLMYQAAAFVALGVAFIGLTLLMQSPSPAGPSGLTTASLWGQPSGTNGATVRSIGCDEDRDDADGPSAAGK